MDPSVSSETPHNATALNLLEFRELVSAALDTSSEMHHLSDSFSQFEHKQSTPISYHGGSASSVDSCHPTPSKSPVARPSPPPSMTPPEGTSPSSSSDSHTPSRIQTAFKRIKRQASAHFRSIKKKTVSASIAFPASLAQTAHKFSSKSEKLSPQRSEPERAFTPYLPWAHQIERTQGHPGPSSSSLSDSPTSIHSAVTAPIPLLAHSSSNRSISTVIDGDTSFPITPVTPSSGFGVLDAVLDKDDELHSDRQLTSRWSRYTDDADSGFLESATHFPGSDSPSEYSQSGEAEESHHHTSASEYETEARLEHICGETDINIPDDAGLFGPYKLRDRCCSPLKPSDSPSTGGLLFPESTHQLGLSVEASSRISRNSSRKTSSGQSAGSKKDYALTVPLNVLYPPSPQRQASLSSASGSLHGKSSRVMEQLKDSEEFSDESDVGEDDVHLGPSPSSWPWPSPPPSPENIEPLKRARRVGDIPPFNINSSPNTTVTPNPPAARIPEKRGSKDVDSDTADEASVYYSACPGARSSQGSQVASPKHIQSAA